MRSRTRPRTPPAKPTISPPPKPCCCLSVHSRRQPPNHIPNASRHRSQQAPIPLSHSVFFAHHNLRIQLPPHCLAKYEHPRIRNLTTPKFVPECPPSHPFVRSIEVHTTGSTKHLRRNTRTSRNSTDFKETTSNTTIPYYNATRRLRTSLDESPRDHTYPNYEVTTKKDIQNKRKSQHPRRLPDTRDNLQSPMLRVETFLEAAFGQRAPQHYEWQTTAPFVSERERTLVRSAFLPLVGRVLDVGCGEGATLYHLGEPEGAVGIDLFEDKLAFARERLPKCKFVAGSVYDLPFDDGSFDHVLVRDVIHHLDEPIRGLRECRRVLRAGGRIDVLEPCRNNPLIFFHAILKPEERGEARSTMTFLTRLLEDSGFTVTSTARYQAFPLHRIVFHPDMGRPSLANNAAVRSIVDGIERAATMIVPRLFWAYIHVRASV